MKQFILLISLSLFISPLLQRNVAIAMEPVISSPTSQSGADFLDNDVWNLLDALKNDMPLTAKAIMELGFIIPDWEPPQKTNYFKCLSVKLNDGTIIESELRILIADIRGGSNFIMNFVHMPLSRRLLEERWGQLDIFDIPRGKSIHERIVYAKKVDNYSILIGCNQTNSDEILTISFNCIVDKENR